MPSPVLNVVENRSEMYERHAANSLLRHQEDDDLSVQRMLDDINERPRSSNRILFDDKFNDEFVVIENSPKSQLIQSLDENDIIEIKDDEDYNGFVDNFEIDHSKSLELPDSPLKKSMSPIFRAKSMEDNVLPSSSSSPASNHIVSILKRKNVDSASSASSNASPVTFSPSVVDTPRSNRKQSILKKRCSLDESRYSRSHSPDEKSILVKHTRRNSFEEVQHGILKQKSYESKEDVSGSGEKHGILKKKDSSNSTPNENQKHVSISQAVILAAAEICQDLLVDDEHEIRPILKQDHSQPATPKPILKKKYSSENEEIRPILKSSRKSSREESDNEEKKSILKTDSPLKRRSFGDQIDQAVLLQRSKSLEHPDQVPGVQVVPQITSIEKPIISVAERIKNMEKFLNSNTGKKGSVTAASSSSSTGAVPKGTASSRRESYRYKTQPVTSDEINR